jgi:signal transduction histidine kinase
MLEEHLRASQRAGALARNLRWLLLLLAALFILGTGTDWSALAVGVLVVSGMVNFLLGLLDSQGLGQRWLPAVSLVSDFAVGLGLFAATGAARGPLLWIGLLPGLTSTLRLGMGQTVLVTLAFVAGQAAVAWALGPRDDLSAMAVLAGTAAVLLPGVVVCGRIAARLRWHIGAAVRRQQQTETRRANALREHARAIYDMSSMVSATLNYKQVLEAAMNFGARGAEGYAPTASNMVAAVLFFEDDLLHVASSRRLTAADQRVTCAGRAGLLGDVIRTGEPALLEDPERDPELQQFVSFRPCRTLLALPLRAGYETYGVVLYAHPQPGFFDADQRALLEAVVNQAIIGLQNAQLYRNLRAEKERLVEVQEEAQKKLARDLHDGPTQAVAALSMRSNFVRRLVERDPKAAGEELFKMEELARKTTREIRHMLFTLRPLILETAGLTAALEQLAEKMRETHGQNVVVEADKGVDHRLDLGRQGVLFYIVEEAVNNARKHAQAEHIWVRLKVDDRTLNVEVQDDGVGFNVGAIDTHYERRGSLGLVNMRERAEMINGLVRIEAAENQGTRVSIFIPLTEAAREKLRV